MEFIGRTSELSTLEAEYRRDNGFVVLYGRRRVGKTTLIKKFIEDKTAFYFLATQEAESQSMKRMAGVLARKIQNPLLRNVTFSDWMDLFQVIADYRSEEKKIIVIDEFPYLVKTNPAFPSILQSIWDEILKERNIMLILCGSLISMMKRHALSHESPLYGRRTAQIRLMPLQFMEIYPNQAISFENAVARYAVTGGIPKYLEFFHDDISLQSQLSEVVFSKNGFLYEEPNFLLNEEVQAPASYFSILKTIADGNHKAGKIGSVLGMDSSALSPYLSTLIELGFITKDTPITEKNPERSRKGLYFLSDHFIRFWFRYVYPYKGELELDNQQIVLDEMEKDFTEKFVPFAYERVCRNIFAVLCRKKEISFIPSRIGSYWLNDLDGDTEIDVAAVDHQNKQLFVGECKFRRNPVDISVYASLKDKVCDSSELAKAFKGYRVIYGLFSKSGFESRLVEISKSMQDLILIQECGKVVS